MRAVVLAGGYGLRLRPLTRRRSAALLPVAGRPIVEYVLEHLVRYGVDTATVALHHEASQIERLLGDGTRAGLRLDYALERVPLGTGGAPRRVAAGWREPFVLAAATALVTTDLTKVIAFHREKRAILTLPYYYHYDDQFFLLFPPQGSGLEHPDALVRNWRAEFDAQYRRGRFFSMTIHPHIIGWANRMHVLEEFLDHVSSFPDLWNPTGADCARHWQVHYPPSTHLKLEKPIWKDYPGSLS